MQKAVTAIYRTHHTGNLIRDEVASLGIPADCVHIIPDDPMRPGTGEYREVEGYNRGLHALHLPEDDMRIYQQAVRNGDYVVSVDVDDETQVEAVKEIMRRPEDAYDLNALHAQYEGEDYVPYRHEGAPYGEDQRGVRDPIVPGEPAHVRDYSRAQPLRDPDSTLGGKV